MTWIQTYTGEKFDFSDLDNNNYCIIDIAHALSNQCRFGGHSNFHYSVAQHSVYMSHRVSEQNQLAALLHDAAEAYVVDIPRPLKRLVLGKGSGYEKFENDILTMIMRKFGVIDRDETLLMPMEIAVADNRMLMTEKEQVCGRAPEPWGIESNFEAYEDLEIEWWTQERAKNEFIWRFERLTGQKIHMY